MFIVKVEVDREHPQIAWDLQVSRLTLHSATGIGNPGSHMGDSHPD